MNTATQTLESFEGFDNLATEEDLFAEIPDAEGDVIDNPDEPFGVDVMTPIKKEPIVKAEPEPAADNKKAPAKAKLPKDDLFKIVDEAFGEKAADEGVKPKPAETKAEPEANRELSNVDTFNLLVKQGLVKVYDEDDFSKLTEDEASTLISERHEDSFRERMNETLEALPEDVSDLNKFVLDGGDYKQYFQMLARREGGAITDKIDLSSEKNQELVIRESMREEGNDEEEIDAIIGYMKEKGTLSSMSEKRLAKWKSSRESEKQAMIAKQQQVRLEYEAKNREEKQVYAELISQNNEIGDVPIPKDVKRTLASYISDKNVLLQGGVKITALQRDLYHVLPRNKKAMMQLAVFMKNLNKDGTFNTNFLTERKVTKVVNAAKDGLDHAKNGMPTKSATSSGKDFMTGLRDYYTRRDKD